MPKANALRIDGFRTHFVSARSSDRESEVHALGVENGRGSAGALRINEQGMYVRNARISERMLFDFAHANH
ncbi:MAG: hypothetical protein KDB27_22415, partial [Planctomycetales bacterium]|nr:hypothetical protein [Planctomycetales bacterium]